MSGTSLDGIDVAIVEIGRAGGSRRSASRFTPYPEACARHSGGVERGHAFGGRSRG
jgi:1,6-anhydro-N-acetylmuramate kinase